MLNLSLSFLAVALIAALFGFTGIASVAVDFAMIAFYIFGALFLITAVAALFSRNKASHL